MCLGMATNLRTAGYHLVVPGSRSGADRGAGGGRRLLGRLGGPAGAAVDVVFISLPGPVERRQGRPDCPAMSRFRRWPGRNVCDNRRLVTRAVCIVEERASLPQLVDEIEVAGVPAGETQLVRGVCELIEHLR